MVADTKKGPRHVTSYILACASIKLHQARELISVTRAFCTAQLTRSCDAVQEDPYSGLIGDSYRAPDEKAQFRLELQRMVTVSPCDLSGVFETSTGHSF